MISLPELSPLSEMSVADQSPAGSTSRMATLCEPDDSTRSVTTNGVPTLKLELERTRCTNTAGALAVDRVLTVMAGGRSGSPGTARSPVGCSNLTRQPEPPYPSCTRVSRKLSPVGMVDIRPVRIGVLRSHPPAAERDVARTGLLPPDHLHPVQEGDERVVGVDGDHRRKRRPGVRDVAARVGGVRVDPTTEVVVVVEGPLRALELLPRRIHRRAVDPRDELQTQGLGPRHTVTLERREIAETIERTDVLLGGEPVGQVIEGDVPVLRHRARTVRVIGVGQRRYPLPQTEGVQRTEHQPLLDGSRGVHRAAGEHLIP